MGITACGTGVHQYGYAGLDVHTVECICDGIAEGVQRLKVRRPQGNMCR